MLYELASSSDAVIEQVETGQLPPTVDAIKAAREAERQARLEVETRQAAIERLTLEIERRRRRLAEMPAPEIEVREGEKLVAPPEMSLQLDTLRQKIVTLTRQRDTLSEQVSQLQEQARASASAHLEGEHERRVRLSQIKELSRRLLEECARLAQRTDGRIIDGSKVSAADAIAEREASS